MHEEQRSGRKFFVTENLKYVKYRTRAKQTIHNFWITRNFSSCVSLSDLGSCYRISHSRNANEFTAVNSEPTPRPTDKSSLFVARRCAKKRRTPDTRIPQILQVAKFENSSIQPRPCTKWYSLLSVTQIFVRPESEEEPRDKRRRLGLAGLLGNGLFDEGI